MPYAPEPQKKEIKDFKAEAKKEYELNSIDIAYFFHKKNVIKKSKEREDTEKEVVRLKETIYRVTDMLCEAVVNHRKALDQEKEAYRLFHLAEETWIKFKENKTGLNKNNAKS